MMLGIAELLIPLGIILIVSLFGRKYLKKVYRDFLGVTKDMKDVKTEFEQAGQDLKIKNQIKVNKCQKI